MVNSSLILKPELQMFRRFAVTACAIAIVASFAMYSRAEDPKPGAPGQMPTPEQVEAMQKAWEENMKVGEEHKKMAEMVGEWTAVVEDYSAGPMQKSEGEAKFTMILDGRFLQQEFHGSMGTEKFDGVGITGYNNSTKQFEEIWMDSMGTAIYFAKGSRVDASTTETKGKMTMPGMGELDTRSVAKHVDKDHMIFEMYGPGSDGKEALWIRISYTRRA
jgi:hypothetical protein